MSVKFKLLDFNIYNEDRENDSDDSDSDSNSSNGRKYKQKQDQKIFVIQMFGLNEHGETFSVFVENYQPFFFMRVEHDWTQRTKGKFLSHIKDKVGDYYKDSIMECKLTKKHKLYGFDNHKNYKFVMMKFKNTTAMNKVKNLFYYKTIVMTDDDKEETARRLKPNGYRFNNTNIKLYEANIPPLLRYFHMRNISPSGWISIPKEHLQHHCSNMTTCTYEYTVNETEIISLPYEETNVPYKICSFDIEASSSHGDFPLPTKNYKKLTANILDYWDKNIDDLRQDTQDEWEFRLRTMILFAFNFIDDVDGVNIDIVYPKNPPKTKENVISMIDKVFKTSIDKTRIKENTLSVTTMFQDDYIGGECDNCVEEYDNHIASSKYKNKSRSKSVKQKSTIFDILNDVKCDREERLNDITKVFDGVFPQLKGDKVTFIGSTFIRNGEKDPYLNHCIALDTCDDVNNSVIESYKTEKEVLLAWTKLIQKENPDIIIGYNIFGFDYKFMFHRAKEVRCLEQFLQLSRNVDETCCKNIYTEKLEMDEKNIKIASGEHKLSFIKMAGRVQIDMYNYFRREYNLTSYKLDYVSGHFIGDKVKKIEHQSLNATKIYSKNLAGLKDGNFIHFEEIGHSTEYYKDGAKFEVSGVSESNGTFIINDVVAPDMTKSVKWCLAKDDVTPQDIFRLTNQGPTERAIVAKYCIQDCNLVHHLLNKIDVITGFVEMAKLCSVPFDFLIMRGQGIKLFSFIAKKCRETDTLIPVVEKKNDGGYEGAIVLEPKCGLYLDEPVACVDYSSLYPSSMISENISHDSKVWTREYDLNGNLIAETGIKDIDGKYVYDNLPGHTYVDIEYDTYKYIRKTPKGAEIKTKVGRKICRFAQFPNNDLAIMPKILKDLLAARKATRASAKFKTIKTSIGDYTGMIIEKDTKTTTLKDKDGNIKVIENKSIQEIENTYTDFMKNVLDKRQIAIKLTANSLYGQCGARTSSFYEKDVAASTTATGRKLLTYGKRVIEEVYGNKICETKYGTVHSHAEYIYGDSVTGDTPILLKRICDDNIIIKRFDELDVLWDTYEEFKPFDTYSSNRINKQQSNTLTEQYEVWTKNGWSKIKRIIRHKCNKRIYRISTHDSVVDVTEDHSLLDEHYNIIKPSDSYIGQNLLTHNINTCKANNTLTLKELNESINNISICSIEEKKAFLRGFFMGDGSCGIYHSKKWSTKYSWALNNANMQWCLILKSLLEEVYLCNFKILDTIQSSGVYKIVPVGSIKKFVIEYLVHYNINKNKIVPTDILNSPYIIQQAFFKGYYCADGEKCTNQIQKNIRFDCKNKITASTLYYLVSKLGFNVSINSRKDKDIYRITCTKQKLRKISNAIKDIYIKHESYNDFVYDIETINGTFNTGFPLIIKNTDSVFMSFKLTDLDGNKISGKEALKHTIELAKEAGALATQFLKAPHDLEYEKTFMPFCLLSKKRYVGMLYEEDPDKCYRKSMGIVLKRRDNAPIVKDIYGGIIDILMKEQDVTKAIAFTQQCLQDMVDEKYPLDKLIITKSLREFYKNPAQIAHKVLADRMGKRDPGNKPGPGDRIPFVYIQKKGKKVLQGDRIESPNYIIKHKPKIKPDYAFYITNQIMKPVQQVFALVLQDIPNIVFRNKANFFRKLSILKDNLVAETFIKKEQILRNKEVKELIFQDYLRKCNNLKTGQMSIKSFYSR